MQGLCAAEGGGQGLDGCADNTLLYGSCPVRLTPEV